MRAALAYFLLLAAGHFTLGACGSFLPDTQPSKGPRLEVILSGLHNPRGVAIGPRGELFVAEAGTGYDAVDPVQMTGRFTKFTDLNRDGDFEDRKEAERWFSHFPTYNALHYFNTRRDEVSGPGDLLLHPDGRLYLSVDGGLDRIGLYEISPEGRIGRNLADRSNMNGLAFDPKRQVIYAVESMANRLIEVSLKGEIRNIVTFPLLASGQQAVPAGLAVDPQSGEVLVALFSGTAVDPVTQEAYPFVPGEARVVRVDPASGEMRDEIDGLTTAVDVAVDREGNLFVVEMASDYADLLPRDFDLFDARAPALHGGYVRYSGRIRLYIHNGEGPCTVATGLDMPTNITIGPNGDLYISTGQGTPGRPIPGPQGPTRIVGEVLRVTNPTASACD